MIILDKNRYTSLNNRGIDLFIKNYYKIISNNSDPNNMTNKNLLTIIACHTNTNVKYNTVVNNIPYLLFPNNDIIIVNSSNEKYSNKLKKYVNNNKKYQLLSEYDEPLISFSNSYYKGNKYGVQDYINVKIFNYVLFWNKVNSLDNSIK